MKVTLCCHPETHQQHQQNCNKVAKCNCTPFWILVCLSSQMFPLSLAGQGSHSSLIAPFVLSIWEHVWKNQATHVGLTKAFLSNDKFLKPEWVNKNTIFELEGLFSFWYFLCQPKLLPVRLSKIIWKLVFIKWKGPNFGIGPEARPTMFKQEKQKKSKKRDRVRGRKLTNFVKQAVKSELKKSPVFKLCLWQHLGMFLV